MTTTEDEPIQLDPARLDRLARGEVFVDTEPVPGFKVPRAIVWAVIDAPPERVWPLIDEVNRYERIMSGVKRATELSRDGDVVRAKVTVGLPFPLPDLTSVTEAHHSVVPGERWVRRWRLLEGDYQENTGSWTLVPFEEDPARTLVRYRLLAVPRIPIPGRIQRLTQSRAFPRLMEQLRELAGASSG